MAFKLRSGNGTTFKNMGTSPFKDMKTGKYEHSFESPAKQWKGTEGQDQDKIFNNKGEHVGDWVNDKKVMHVQKDPKDTSIKPKKEAKERKSPAKHTDKVDEGSNRDPKHAAAHNKRHAEGGAHGEIGSKDNKWIEKTSPAKQYAAGGTKKGKGNIFTKRGRKQRQLNKYAKEEAFENYEFYQAEEKRRKESSPAKQTDTTWADGTKKSKRQIAEQKIHPSEYWYKIDGKKATKAQYIKYKNVPGNMEGGGKQTNDPTVSLARQSANKRQKKQ